MNDINDILQTFDPISLREMDNVALMERMDTKYVFTFGELPVFLGMIKNDYRVLDVNSNRISKYESLYFDTLNFSLYYAHHNGAVNRFKIRYRNYVESNLNFFEVKFKNNRGRTIKNRVKRDQIDLKITEDAELLLKAKTPMESDNLEAKLWVNYSRITLVNKHSPERVTIDLNLTFKKGELEKTITNLIIAEVKQDKAVTSEFIKVMKAHHIREGSISKYCYGVISLFSYVKHNNFKPSLILIKKILNGTFARA
jgi:hypothetical protein